MSNGEKYASVRVKLYEEMVSRSFDYAEQTRLRNEAAALWPILTEEEKREGERGYFAGVQDFNRRDPNYQRPGAP